MRADDRDLRKSPSNLFDILRTHSVRRDVFGFGEFGAQHDSRMKKYHPFVAIREFVDFCIRRIDVGFLWEFEFSKTSIAEVVKLLDLLRHIGRVEQNRSHGDDARRMLFRGFGNLFPVFKWREYAPRDIQMLGRPEKIVDEPRRPLIVQMNIDNPSSSHRGCGRRSCGVPATVGAEFACSGPERANVAAAAVLSVPVTNDRRESSSFIASPGTCERHHNLPHLRTNFAAS